MCIVIELAVSGNSCIFVGPHQHLREAQKVILFTLRWKNHGKITASIKTRWNTLFTKIHLTIQIAILAFNNVVSVYYLHVILFFGSTATNRCRYSRVASDKNILRVPSFEAFAEPVSLPMSWHLILSCLSGLQTLCLDCFFLALSLPSNGLLCYWYSM